MRGGGGGGGVVTHIALLILNLALDRYMWSNSHFGRFVPGMEP